jgi:hypothetical protein
MQHSLIGLDLFLRALMPTFGMWCISRHFAQEQVRQGATIGQPRNGRPPRAEDYAVAPSIAMLAFGVSFVSILEFLRASGPDVANIVATCILSTSISIVFFWAWAKLSRDIAELPLVRTRTARFNERILLRMKFHLNKVGWVTLFFGLSTAVILRHLTTEWNR